MTVHLLCGLNGAGKSTYARELARSRLAVRLSLDEWMIRLYGLPFDDPEYGKRVEPCRDLIWTSAQEVLRCGVDVILDWNCWSRRLRRRWADRASAVPAEVVVHYVDVPVSVAIQRARQRVDPSSHAIDEAGVRHLAGLFEPPTADEALRIVTVCR